MSLRLVGEHVVPCEGEGRIIDGGAIDIGDDGRIVAIGPEVDLGPAPGEVRKLGGLLMPGLVNAHAHTPMTVVRSAGDGLPLERWLREGVWPREARMNADDAWWGMALGSAEMLALAVTPRYQLGEVPVALVMLHQQHEFVRLIGVVRVTYPRIDTGDRLNTLHQSCFVKTHQSKQV